MSSNDYWRKKEEEDKRRKALYDAMRRGDNDEAVRQASPDTFLEFLKLRESHRMQSPNNLTSPPPTISAQLLASLKEEQKNLVELTERTSLDIHGRSGLIHMVYAIDLWSPDASEKINQLRKHIEQYI